MKRFHGSIVLAAVVAASGSCARPTEPAVGPDGIPEFAKVAAFRILTDPASVFPGMRMTLSVAASNVVGNPLNTDEAAISVSDTSVAKIESAHIALVDIDGSGRLIRQVVPVLRLYTPGTTYFKVTLRERSDSVLIRVLPTRLLSTALVVDSFAVVEYRVTCSFACPYIAYAPLLRLREPTGTVAAEVVGVEFRVGGLSTGFCRGSAHYEPGQSAHLNSIDPFLWNNDLIFVQVSGIPLPGDSATATVLVRSATGEYGFIDVSGPILRLPATYALPTSGAPNIGWSC